MKLFNSLILRLLRRRMGMVADVRYRLNCHYQKSGLDPKKWSAKHERKGS